MSSLETNRFAEAGERFTDGSCTEEKESSAIVKNGRFTLEEILSTIGTNRIQLVIMLMAGLAYASFMEQGLLPTLATSSVWLKWPDLELDIPKYNAVFATAAICRLIASLVFIPLNDVVGRRSMLAGSLAVLCLGCGINAAATNFVFYCAMRGLCMGAASILPSTTTMYTMEMVSIKRRAIPSTFLQCFHILSVIYITAVTIVLQLNENSWRKLYLWGIAPMVLSLLLMPIVFHETPRFLVATGREAGAWKVLAKLTPGGKDGLAKRLHVASLDKCHLAGASAKLTTMSIGEKIIENLSRMCQIATNRQLRYNTLLLSLLWGLTAFSYWGANTYMTTFFKYIGIASDGATLACFGVQLPGMLLVYWIMVRKGQWSGRIAAMQLCTFGCGSGLLVLTIAIACGITSVTTFWVLAMYTFFFSGPMWNAIYIYSAEMYPTNVRGAAMALFGTVNAIATLITSYIGSLTVDNKTKWIYPLIWSATWLSALAVCCLLRTETANLDLADKV